MRTWIDISKITYTIPVELLPDKKYTMEIDTINPELVSLLLDGYSVGNFEGGELLFKTNLTGNELILSTSGDGQVITEIRIDGVPLKLPETDHYIEELFWDSDVSPILAPMSALELDEVTQSDVDGWNLLSESEKPICFYRGATYLTTSISTGIFETNLKTFNEVNLSYNNVSDIPAIGDEYFAKLIEENTIVRVSGAGAFDAFVYNTHRVSPYHYLGLARQGYRQSYMNVITDDGTEIVPFAVDVSDVRDSFIGDYGGKLVTLSIDMHEHKGFEIPKTVMLNQGFRNLDYETYDNPYNQIGQLEYAHTNLDLYYIDEVESTYDDENLELELVGYTKENQANKRVVDEIPFPMTGNQLMTYVSQKIGFEEYINDSVDDVIFAETIFSGMNYNLDEFITYAEIIKDYARLNMVSAHVNESGRLVFRDTLHQTPREIISEYDYDGDFKIGTEQVINIITYDHEDYEDPIYYRNEASITKYGEHEYRFTDSRLLDVLERSEVIDYINNLGNKLFTAYSDGYHYMPFDGDNLFIIPTLNSGDVITVQTKEGRTYRSHISDFRWSYTPALEGDIECAQLPETLTDFTLSEDDVEQFNMGIKVDRVKKEITSTIGTLEREVNDTLDGFGTEITQTQTSISDVVRDFDDNVGEVLTSKKVLTAEDFTLEFAREAEDKGLDGEELQKIISTFRVSGDGVIISASGSPIEFYAENDEVGFRMKDNPKPMAYWKGGTMHVDNLIAIVKIVIGHHHIDKFESAVAGKTTLIQLLE